MENIQVLRYIATLESRLKNLENNSSGFVTSNNLVNSIIPPTVDLTDIYNRIASLEGRPTVDLSDVNNRIASLEGRPTVDLTDVNNRIAALEGRPTVDLSDVNNRIAALESRPDVMQRLSALELTVASLNSSS
jgi:histone H3/H4